MAHANTTKIVNDTTQQAPRRGEEERIRQLRVVGWTASVIAVFAVVTFSIKPAWQFALAIAAVQAMVAAFCFWSLKRGKLTYAT